MKDVAAKNQVSVENQISINVSINGEVIELPEHFEPEKFDNLFKLSFKGEQIFSVKEITPEKLKKIIHTCLCMDRR